jgi:aconitate hydratase
MIAELRLSQGTWRYVSLRAAEDSGVVDLMRAPIVTRILVENVLRAHLTGVSGPAEDVTVLTGAAQIVRACAGREEPLEIALRPTRLLLQDHSGIPVLADLAALRSTMSDRGIDPGRASPQIDVDLVIDHSIESFFAGTPGSHLANLDREFALNAERYRFLKWAERSVERLRVVPPGNGIVHQVHLERLARVVASKDGMLAPELVLGTDSHTPMVNGLGVLGWGVGGIEAQTVMLGDVVSLLSPRVFGVRLVNRLAAGVTATDLALEMVELLRGEGVVDAFVEFLGAGLARLDVPHRATVANMAPEYGCTVAFFPPDADSLRYMRQTGRSAEAVERVERYLRAQGLVGVNGDEPDERLYAEVREFDLAAVRRVVAAPHRPSSRTALADVPAVTAELLRARADEPALAGSSRVTGPSTAPAGAVVLAAIVSCTNTSNPESMMLAGLVARRAVKLGIEVAPWVKTVLAPGSLSVPRYLRAAGLLEPLQHLGFHIVGFGCTACIGSSGPLSPIGARAAREGIPVFAVLSGNRNFEARIHPDIVGSYLASPALVVAFALAGTVSVDLENGPLGCAPDGRAVFLEDLWPSPEELSVAMSHVSSRHFIGDGRSSSASRRWAALSAPKGRLYDWKSDSSYLVPSPLYSVEAPAPLQDLAGARALVLAGDSVTTDHISPAGSIAPDSPAAAYLHALGVEPMDLSSYGARRGNHHVLTRGVFANARFHNRLAGGERGGFTTHVPSGQRMTIYDAAARYRAEFVPQIIIAGTAYGTGSSRDWAAKGPALLGVRAVLAESFERIHRGNLLSVGVLPLEFLEGQGAEQLGLSGLETFGILGVGSEATPRGCVTVIAAASDGARRSWRMRTRIDTSRELAQFHRGGSLRALLQRMLEPSAA